MNPIAIADDEPPPVAEKSHTDNETNEPVLLANSCSFPKPIRGIRFWTPPRQRQRWGDDDMLPHVNWGDLFFDLFYVASAYNLSYVLFNDPSTLGLLYYIGLFGPILLEWFTRTFFDARFSWSDDPYHTSFEIVHLCMLALSVVHIRPVSSMSDPSQPDMFSYSLGVSVLALLNICRSVEIIIKVDGQDAARVGEKKFVLGFAVQGAFYLSACIHAGWAYYTGISSEDLYYENNREIRSLQSITNVCTKILNMNSESQTRHLAEEVQQNHIPIILCLCGWVSNWIVLVIRVYFFEADGGEHKKYNVPMNIEYIIHRFGELVMLLLGESILSILIVSPANSADYYVTFYASIISIVLLEYCHYRYQPHKASEHAFRRSKTSGVYYYGIMMVYCISLVALGTSYKMFLYAYTYEEAVEEVKENLDMRHLIMRSLAGEANGSNYSSEERMTRVATMFCISIASVWICLEAMWITHQGLEKYLSFLRWKWGLLTIIIRYGLIAVMATISQYTVSPEEVVLIGFACIDVKVVTIVIAEYLWTRDHDALNNENNEEYSC